MIKQFNVNISSINTDITMFAEFGFDPHIVVCKHAAFDRADYPLFSPCALQLPAWLFASSDYVTFRMSGNSIRNYSVDLENAAISFDTTFKGVGEQLVIPLEHIVSSSNGDGVPYVKLEYVMHLAGVVTILNPKVEHSGTDATINAIVSGNTPPSAPAKKKNPFTLVGKDQ